MVQKLLQLGELTIIDMPLQNKPVLTDGRIFDDKEKAVKNKSIVDYAFLGGLVHANKENIKELHKEGVVGFKSFIGPVSTDYRSLNIGEARNEHITIHHGYGNLIKK